jgi:hypothetical protein
MHLAGMRLVEVRDAVLDDVTVSAMEVQSFRDGRKAESYTQQAE